MPGLTTLSKSAASRVSERISKAHLIALDNEKGQDDPTYGGANGSIAFQYWPDTISDTKAVNWSPREIPGASLPIYQWISSGERVISFTAVFTCDVDLLAPNVQSNDVRNRLKSIGQGERNVDIRSAFAWLRSFMLPSYEEQNGQKGGIPLAIAPRRLLLVMPGTGIGIYGGASTSDGKTSNLNDRVRVIMTQCDLTIEASFPSGLPRIATAGLAFAQTAQAGNSGVIQFPQGVPSSGGYMAGFIKGSGDGVDDKAGPFGYQLEPRKA